MQVNKIGEKVALFWIAWAFVAEKAGNNKLTDQIFQKVYDFLCRVVVIHSLFCGR
jgi:hypothetical protein